MRQTIEEILESYISKTRKDPQVNAFNKQVHVIRKDKQRDIHAADTEKEKDTAKVTAANKLTLLGRKKDAYKINKRKNKDLNTVAEADDTTLERYRREIEYKKRSTERRVKMTDDPLQKADIQAKTDKEILDKEKKIETLKKRKPVTPLPYKKPEKENKMSGGKATTVKTKVGEERVMVDEKEIKAALDAFENDDFITAKEKLKGQIAQAKDEYLKNKLGLEGSTKSE